MYQNSIVIKVLGLIWEKQKENITLSFKNLIASIYPCPAKRQLLSFIASVSDPLGFINLFVFPFKNFYFKWCVDKS